VIDGLGAVQSVLLVGGSSEIGLAIVDEFARLDRLERVVLAGRSPEASRVALREKYPHIHVESLTLDLAQPLTVEQQVRAIWGAGIDVTILAAGVLPQEPGGLFGPLVLLESGLVNFVGQMIAGTTAIELMKGQGQGVLVVLSSVAAERPRVENFVYGSTKGGLDMWANGVADLLAGTPIRVMVVRPGMVRTRMSNHLREAPMTCGKEDVARAVGKNLIRGPVVVWVPGKLRWVMAVLRHLPRPIFRKLASRGWKSQGAR
jgi:decaprenylphospho-beta-D-erythro-pentofuranosid-2-ulose 2-reductase